MSFLGTPRGLLMCWLYCILYVSVNTGFSFARIRASQAAHTTTALTLCRLCSTPPPPLSLPVSALLARIRCVSQAASRQQTFGERQPGLRSHYARTLCVDVRHRRDAGLFFFFQFACAVSKDNFWRDTHC